MATAEPQKWSATLGANADVNTLPATTPAGSGRASTNGLFPPITQQPLDEGGLAPERADFNALFKYLGEYIYYAMQGGVYTYVTTYNYTAGNFVLHEGSLYLCIAANGPGSSVKYPTDTAYWRRLALMSDIPSPPTVNNGILTIQKNGSTVATFTANQAGNTTANITVPAPPTVGNGKITVQASGTTLGSFTANQGSNSTINIPAASASAFGVVKIGSGITVTDGVISMSGSSYTGPQIFFAAADSTQDAAIRAAGFWRCGRGYHFWQAYGPHDSAGGRWYICYAPNGHTITEVDLCWSYAQYVVCSVNGSDGSTSFAREGCMSWEIPHATGGSGSQTGVDIPTVGMTSASEVAFPANPFAPN